MDFTLEIYVQLLNTLQTQGFFFIPFCKYQKMFSSSTIILRHDVDKLPGNALLFAQIEHELGIKGTYYFRIVPESFDPKIIEKIAALDHEIGYHYEDVDLAYKQINNSQLVTRKPQQIFALAIKFFEKHLEQFRKYYPIQTICMHGSPLSKFDNKLLWKYYNYKDFGIIGEPYFDVDFDNVFYLTDTGRRWDGYKVSVRDKIPQHETWTEKGFTFHHTSDLIQAAGQGKLPNQIMMTIHPQRWGDKLGPWVKELVWQNVKNIVKRIIVTVNSKE